MGMKEPLSLLTKQHIFALKTAYFIEYLNSIGYKVTFGEAYRTKEQAEIYAKEGLGIVHSLHCDRLAVDLNLFDLDDKMLTTFDEIKPFGEHWEQNGPEYRWGGRFKHLVDLNHFEMD
jgi:hypothetical protein